MHIVITTHSKYLGKNQIYFKLPYQTSHFVSIFYTISPDYCGFTEPNLFNYCLNNSSFIRLKKYKNYSARVGRFILWIHRLKDARYLLTIRTIDFCLSLSSISMVVFKEKYH